ncbi:MAG: DNA polymerase-4 [Crocinitomix sp.]
MNELPQRKIIHIDMDAFFTSVEQLDNPELRGKAIAVGGNEKRGVVAAASYEARKFGVRSAMSSALAKKKCPALIFVPHHFDRYKEVSRQIREIFLFYTDLVEPLSLDEAFLDVTDNLHSHKSATEVAKEIRQRIFEETGLTASAGISINKFMAKIGSDINKPNGQKTIKPAEVIPFLETLSINKFFGVGKVTAKKMNSWGIYNGHQLKQHTREFLTQHFGKSGNHFYNIVRGIQHSEVKPNRIRKSVGTERTFNENKYEISDILASLDTIATETEKRMISSKSKGKTITVKIKYNDFTVQTRSRTITEYVDSKTDIWPVVLELIEQDELALPIRLLGISLSNLEHLKKEVVIRENPQLRFAF